MKLLIVILLTTLVTHQSDEPDLTSRQPAGDLVEWALNKRRIDHPHLSMKMDYWWSKTNGQQSYLVNVTNDAIRWDYRGTLTIWNRGGVAISANKKFSTRYSPPRQFHRMFAENDPRLVDLKTAGLDQHYIWFNAESGLLELQPIVKTKYLGQGMWNGEAASLVECRRGNDKESVCLWLSQESGRLHRAQLIDTDSTRTFTIRFDPDNETIFPNEISWKIDGKLERSMQISEIDLSPIPDTRFDLMNCVESDLERKRVQAVIDEIEAETQAISK